MKRPQQIYHSDHVMETDEVDTRHQGAETVAGDIGSQSEFDTAEPDICRHPMSQDQEGTQQGKDKSQIDTDAISATECIRGCMLSKKGGLCDNALYVLGTSARMRERELVLFLVVCIRVILIRYRYCDIRDCYSMR